MTLDIVDDEETCEKLLCDKKLFTNLDKDKIQSEDSEETEADEYRGANE